LLRFLGVFLPMKDKYRPELFEKNSP